MMNKFAKPLLIILALSLLLSAAALVTHTSYAADGAAGINAADTAFIAICAAMVMLMTPALGFFYAGLVRKKNVLSILIQSLVIFCLITAIWALIGYTLAFGKSSGGVVGDLSYAGLNGVGMAPNPDYAPTIPALLYFFFQLKFAAITPALIIGAFAERVKFSSLLIFITLWTVLIYAPVAHWVWGSGGWLKAAGTLDFAGGTVVHVLAGFSALAAAIVIGRRKIDKNHTKPNNVPFVILGAALLWFGWFGFNGGSALAASGVAVNAMVTTNIAAAFAALSWMVTDWLAKGKPTATGIAIGAVCGLVAITPAAGFVSPVSSMVIGLIAGLVSNIVANWRVERTKIDDTLDVFACHGISGVWGALATGIFASAAINAAGADGLLFGNYSLIFTQSLAVVATAAFAFAGSYALLRIIDRLFGLRVSAEAEDLGLDLSVHGESAYYEH